jgi:hypothetical protein
MLVNLFDHHPQLCVWPDDTGFWYGYYPRYDAESYSQNEKIERMLSVMFGQIRSIVDKLEAAKGKAFPFEEAEALFKERAEQTVGSAKSLLSEAFRAFQETYLPDDHAFVHWMEKTTSTEIYASEVFEWFPGAKMIHLIRDPRDNYGSLKSGWEKRYRQYNDSTERLLQSQLERGWLGMKLAAMNRDRFGPERYKVIRFEDLTADPEAGMRELAAFVDVEYDDILLYPTCFGLPWKGNNFEGMKFTKPDTSNIGRWRERITDHEAQVIEFYFEREMQEWGYDLAFPETERMDAAREHYKWHNFAGIYSAAGIADTHKKS